MATQIKKFYGGVHPNEGKLSHKDAIIDAPLLERYTVPLQMHIGAPTKPLFGVGDHVLRGQLIAEPTGFVSAPIHSPTSGVIKDMTMCLSPMGTHLSAMVIESDGEDKACEELAPIENWEDADPAVLRKRVGDAGIVGMGGASFPTVVKLSPPPEKEIDTLILNGVECEPCLTADHRLMLEKPELVVKGALIVSRILGVSRIVIAIEANKPDAVAAMRRAAQGTGIEVLSPRVRYPQGAEKQLIYAVTQRVVPSGCLPMDVRCVVQNVGSAASIAEAVLYGKPSYERITTVTGAPVVSPSNYRFRVGTPYSKALELCGGVKADVPVAKVISGGPMMGMAVYSLDIPIMKNTSGILLLSDDELTQFSPSACIRCGRCNDACPMGMQPGILSAQIETQHFDLAEKWHVMDCIECGCCAYVCPACRPLVQHMRRAKAVVVAARKARKAAAAVKK